MRWLTAVYASLKAVMIATLAVPGGGQAQSADDSAWEAARAAGTPEACQQYLTDYPTGAHASEAFECVVANSAPPSPAAPAPRIWNQRQSQVDIY
jgi:hypothetical protein